MRGLVVHWLRSGGYDVIACASGEECLEKAKTSHPDLVLADVNMPGMNGFDLCRELKATPALARVPVVLFTRLDEARDVLSGLAAGADDFVVKGKGQAELLARLERILGEADGSGPSRKNAVKSLSDSLRLTAGRVDILKLLFEAIDREVAFDALTLLVSPSPTDHMVIVVSRHALPPELGEWVLDQVRSTFELLAQRALPRDIKPRVIVLDSTKDSMSIGSKTERGSVKVPLLDQGRLLGVLGIFRNEPNAQFADNIRFFFELGVESAKALGRFRADS
jgi:DNA-binding response OmpR family regulator